MIHRRRRSHRRRAGPWSVARWLLVGAALSPTFLAAVSTAQTPPVIAEGFESGNLLAWTDSSAFTVVQGETSSGSFAGRALSTGAPVWVYRQLSSISPELFVQVRFESVSRTSAMTLFRFTSATNGSILKVFLNASGKLAYRDDVAKVTRTSPTMVTNGTWRTLQVHALVNGSSGHVDVWLDGVAIPSLSRTESLGTMPIGRFELGDRASGRGFDVLIDDVIADTAPIPSGIDLAPPAAPSGLQLVGVSAQSVDLSWQDPADPDIAGYIVYRDDVQVASVPASASAFTDLPPSDSTVYIYAVASLDDAGNRSLPTSPVRAVMPGFDGETDAFAYAAGDIACLQATPSASGCYQRETSDILVAGQADAVLALGDLQYESGALDAFNTYFDPTWGRVKPSIHPAVGNHEYVTPGASGYFTYFGSTAGDPTKGYYSYDLGTWHVVVLNSNCGKVSCVVGSSQELWLRQDLAAHPAACTLAYWHHPYWTSATANISVAVAPFVADLYNANADLLLVGHDHAYERFAPQTPAGTPDPLRGIREIIVGTGGKSHYTTSNRAPESEVRNDSTFGGLKLTLHPAGYEWAFVPMLGGTFTDTGAAVCH